MSNELTFRDLRRENIICHRKCSIAIWNKLHIERTKEFLSFLKLQGIDPNNFILEVFKKDERMWDVYTEVITSFKIDISTVYIDRFNLKLETGDKSYFLDDVVYIDERNLMCSTKTGWCIVRFSNAK